MAQTRTYAKGAEIQSARSTCECRENILKIEELEAIWLKDLEGLEQVDCAKQMEVSRPTFQRILKQSLGSCFFIDRRYR